MNGYFQVVNQSGKCGIKLIPPTDGGQPIRAEHLAEYISVKNLVCDFKELAKTLQSLETVTYFPTQTEFKVAENEFVNIQCSPDNMSATVRMYAPFQGGNTMSKTEFLREFSSRGICFGLDEAAIDAYLEKRPYCTDVVLANGLAPVQGKDASIEYFFNTDPRVKPTLNEDGSVDFFNLNTINHCTQGMKLAKLTPAVPGKPGSNVKGERIKPRDVKAAILKFGRNISISEDKTELYADVSGHVSLIEGKVFVSNVFEVENVNTAVGNIDYDGSVLVTGNVCENFSIKANGSIEVRGTVEGAYLEAGENIIIARGMNGMHKGVLKAGGNVISKFLENSTVSAGGYIESESIMHCNVVAGTDIKVTGKRGCISGGRACATNSIEVKNLGSEMGADTIVEVGMDTGLKTRIMDLQKRIAEINKQMATIKPVLDGAKAKLSQGIKMSSDQIMQIQKLVKVSQALSTELSNIVPEYNLLMDKQELDVENKGVVVVTGDVYPGTKICISDVSLVVKNSMKYCRFIKDAGDVKMVAIY